MIGWAIGAAGTAAAAIAVSTSLQHQVASSAPSSTAPIGRLLPFLMRQPRWLLGVGVGTTAFVLQAVAVRTGALVVVQPIIMTGIVFAVPVRAALQGRRPSTGDVLGVSLTVTGLVLFVIVANPHTVADSSHEKSAVRVVVVACALMAAAAVGSRRLRTSNGQGLLLCAVAGVAFGLVPGLLKMAMLADCPGLVCPGRLWPILSMLGMGAVGFSLNQRAYRILPLALTMPLLNVISLIVAVVFGTVVFGEMPANDVFSVAIELTALALMGIGIRRLVTMTNRPGYRAGVEGIQDRPTC